MLHESFVRRIPKLRSRAVKYRAMKYEPMPTERWGVWQSMSRCWRLIALVPERHGAKKLAERIASAMNEAK